MTLRKTVVLYMLLLFTAVGAYAQKHLEVLHTNDTHSCIMPLNPNLADTAVAGRGGFLRRVAMIKEERAKNPDLLLIDSGDFSQGSPFYTMFKGDVEVGLMNLMGYDAVTIGNHEFDFGLENMARIFKMAKFPVVCANYDFTGTCVEGLVKPYVIIKRNGLRIGLFGLSPQLEGLVDLSKCKGVTYLDPVEVGNRVAAELKHDKKCDVVICVSHLGWLRPDEMGDQKLLASSKDIDLVLGGHSHSYFKALRYVNNADGKAVPVDQNGKNAMYVGKLTLSFDKK
uniref:bifunctional metallophosphatase/5'-nucleotidase n=1 Tax=Prevotella sp. TaxID=59823 RepID=UPI004026D3E8